MPPATLWPLHEAHPSVLKRIFEDKGLYVYIDENINKPILKNKMQIMLEQKTLKALRHNLKIKK